MDTVDNQRVKEVAKDIELLSRSSIRLCILNELSQHGELHRDEFSVGSEISRTTLQRNLKVLKQQGWIKNTGVSYRITPCGKLVTLGLVELVERITVAKQLREVFRWVPPAELDIDLRLFADSDIWLPEKGDPYSMINRQVKRIRDASEFRGVLRVAGLHTHEASHEAIVEHGATGELIALPEVVNTQTDKQAYSMLTQEMLDTGRFELLMYDDRISFSFMLIDQTVQIVVDEDGTPQAILETDSTEVVEWASELYRQYRAGATLIS